jgi:hypothetical protein
MANQKSHGASLDSKGVKISMQGLVDERHLIAAAGYFDGELLLKGLELTRMGGYSEAKFSSES